MSYKSLAAAGAIGFLTLVAGFGVGRVTGPARAEDPALLAANLPEYQHLQARFEKTELHYCP